MTKRALWFILDVLITLTFTTAIIFSDSINPFLFTWFSGFDCGYVLVRAGYIWGHD